MIPLNICRKLKEVDFPQEPQELRTEYYHWVEGLKDSTAQFRFKTKEFKPVCPEHYFKSPSLEELIKECIKIAPQQDFHLEHLEGENYASSCCFLKMKKEWGGWIVGEDIRIVVANLYIKLKEQYGENSSN